MGFSSFGLVAQAILWSGFTSTNSLHIMALEKNQAIRSFFREARRVHFPALLSGCDVVKEVEHVLKDLL